MDGFFVVGGGVVVGAIGIVVVGRVGRYGVRVCVDVFFLLRVEEWVLIECLWCWEWVLVFGGEGKWLSDSYQIPRPNQSIPPTPAQNTNQPTTHTHKYKIDMI